MTYAKMGLVKNYPHSDFVWHNCEKTDNNPVLTICRTMNKGFDPEPWVCSCGNHYIRNIEYCPFCGGKLHPNPFEHRTCRNCKFCREASNHEEGKYVCTMHPVRGYRTIFRSTECFDPRICEKWEKREENAEQD